MKRAYYYFFYKIYKSIECTSETMGGKFWTEGKAGISIVVLEIWAGITVLNLYGIINNINPDSSITNPVIFIPLLLIIILNYMAFDHYNDVWKKYKKEFENLPKNRNVLGGIFVWMIILFIIIIFFVSTFMLHKIIYGKY